MNLRSFLILNSFLGLSSGVLASPPVPGSDILSAAECARTLRGLHHEELNLRSKSWATVRPLADHTPQRAWDAHITPRRPSLWVDRQVRVHYIDGRSYSGKVSFIETARRSDPQSFLQLAALHVKLEDGTFVPLATTKIIKVEVQTTMVSKSAFAAEYGPHPRLRINRDSIHQLLRSAGQSLALLTKLEPFHDQVVISGRMRPLSHRNLLMIDVQNGPTIEVPIDSVLAYADITPAEGN